MYQPAKRITNQIGVTINAERVSFSKVSTTTMNAKKARTTQHINAPPGTLNLDAAWRSGNWRRKTRYAARIRLHTTMNSTEDTVVISVKAAMTLAPAYKIARLGTRHATENSRPRAGTWLRDQKTQRIGARPSRPRPKSKREVGKITLWADDAADVNTTKLMTPAAGGSPAWANICTNRL